MAHRRVVLPPSPSISSSSVLSSYHAAESGPPSAPLSTRSQRLATAREAVDGASASQHLSKQQERQQLEEPCSQPRATQLTRRPPLASRSSSSSTSASESDTDTSAMATASTHTPGSGSYRQERGRTNESLETPNFIPLRARAGGSDVASLHATPEAKISPAPVPAPTAGHLLTRSKATPGASEAHRDPPAVPQSTPPAATAPQTHRQASMNEDAASLSSSEEEEEPIEMDLATARRLAASLAPRDSATAAAAVATVDASSATSTSSPREQVGNAELHVESAATDEGGPRDPAWMRVYINSTPTLVSRAAPTIHPSALFGPYVLLLDDTAAVVQQQKQQQQAAAGEYAGKGAILANDVPPDIRVATLTAAYETVAGERRRVKNVLDGIRGRLKRSHPAANTRSRDGHAVGVVIGNPVENPETDSSNSDRSRSRARLAEAQQRLDELKSELGWIRDALRAEKKTLARWEKGGSRRRHRRSTATTTITHSNSDGASAAATAVRCPPVLLLPSATTGLVRLTEGHHYRTVKFIGEHLRLTGRLDSWLPPQLSFDGNDKKSGLAATNRVLTILPESAHVPTTGPSASKCRPPEWAVREYGGMLSYLRSHPGSCADDFFKLPVEEIAAHTEADDEWQ